MGGNNIGSNGYLLLLPPIFYDFLKLIKGSNFLRYLFKCPKCDIKKEIEIRISEYTNKGHYCDCGTEMKRDKDDFATNFDTSKISGFCGKCN